MKCEPIFKYGNEDEFGEQKYVTVEMLRRFCRNDSYLKKETERLEYLTPPAIRKRFNPVLVDEAKSYGHELGANNNVVFDDGAPHYIDIDFNNPDVVDMAMTTANIINELDRGEYKCRVETPVVTVSELNKDTRTWSPWAIKDDEGNIIGGDLTCNEHWRVSFDPDKQYALRPNWLQNELNNEIPSIGRAQTFKAKASGILEAVTLNIHATAGSDINNTASPLIVQIRKCDLDGIVHYPNRVGCGLDNTRYEVLAEQRVRFNNSQPEIATITFDSPCKVEADEFYAIVVLSPLSHPTHCYWLGGWNKHCDPEVYAEGNAFYTCDNGMTWIRYGKDEEVDYHLGKYAPQDFAFQCHIREVTEEYEKNTDHYLYLKPIMHSNILGVEINATDNGMTVYEVSRNGREWQQLSKENIIGTRSESDSALHWNMLFVRAKLRTSTDNPVTIHNMNVHLYTGGARQMYVRTIPYTPKTTAMLGANIWGRIHAPFEVDQSNEDNKVECEAEIISMKEAEERFTFIAVTDLENYVDLLGLDSGKIVGKNEVQLANYLKDNVSVRELLAQNNIYVLPSNDIYFFNEIKFTNSPAYPFVSATMHPISGQSYSMAEWIDYMFNYGEKTMDTTVADEEIHLSSDSLYIYKDVVDTLPRGTLTLRYNPCYFKNITAEDMADDGLVLDYINKDYEVTPEMVESRQLVLDCCPVDPIRKVLLNDEELYEDTDFTVDYDAKTLEFNVVNSVDGTSMLNAGDTLTVVYTPNIDDISLCVGYYATRGAVGRTARILPNYFEYKG